MAKIKIDRRKYYRESLRLYAKLSGNFTRTLDKLFISQKKLAVRRYAKYEIIGDSFYFGLATKLHKAFDKNAKQVFENSKQMTQRMREIKATDKEDLELYNPVIAENVTQVTQTTKIMIERSIVSSLNDGLGTEDTAKRLAESSAFSRQRSRVIARTETHQAMNYANNTIAKRMNLKKPVKKWASALDERTRGWHRDMNSKPAIGIDEMFMVLTPTAGGAITERFMSYTGDPAGGASNVIQCRCFTLYYDQDDDVIEGATTVKKPKKLRKPKVKPVVISPAKINETSLAKPIQGSALQIESGAKVRKELKERIEKNNADPRYKIFRDDPQGRKVNKGSGKVTLTLSKYTDRELTELKIVMNELDELSDFYKIPKISGLGGESNYTASMGYGVLNINKKYYDAGKQSGFTKYWNPKENQFVSKDWLNKHKNVKLADYKIGQTPYSKATVFHGVNDYTVNKKIFSNPSLINEKAIQDLSLAQKRAVAYHEFAHHLHNSFKAGTKKISRTRFSRTPTGGVERNLEEIVVPDMQLRGKLRKELTELRRTVELESRRENNGASVLFPSYYSSTNEFEWFAENFSAYHMGFKDVTSPYFVKFLKKEVLSKID